MALNTTPTIKTRRNILWRLVWRFVSKTDNNINPHPPINELSIARMLKARSLFRIIGINLSSKEVSVFPLYEKRCTCRPECRSHLSITSDAKKHTAVTEHPATNNGLRISAPTSDMYAIEPSCDTYLGRPCASHVISIDNSVPFFREKKFNKLNIKMQDISPNQIKAPKRGIQTYSQ